MKDIKTIKDTFFEGERPLFASHGLRLENVKFYPGESALKESSDITAVGCEFMGKYPFWHNVDTEIRDSLFTVYARAAVWYSRNIRMMDTRVEAPKMFREVRGLYLENVTMPGAGETLWNCHDMVIKNLEARGADYIFMNCTNIEIDNINLQGNYSFQDAKNVEIRNSRLDSKDAFWNTENVTVRNSVITGEYLGWHSKNLRLVDCVISGTQPLCYAENLVMENCTMTDCDLAFEYSTVQASVRGNICSVKNPARGSIIADSIGEIIIDENCRDAGMCIIEDKSKQ